MLRLLLVRAPAGDLVDAQVRVRAVAEADRRARAAHFLDRDDVLEIAEPEPAVGFGHGDAVQPELAHRAATGRAGTRPRGRFPRRAARSPRRRSGPPSRGSSPLRRRGRSRSQEWRAWGFLSANRLSKHGRARKQVAPESNPFMRRLSNSPPSRIFWRRRAAIDHCHSRPPAGRTRARARSRGRGRAPAGAALVRSQFARRGSGARRHRALRRAAVRNSGRAGQPGRGGAAALPRARRDRADRHGDEPRRSFCVHTMYGGQPMEVPDAALDDRFVTNSFVAGEPFIRFYAGLPADLRGGRPARRAVRDRHRAAPGRPDRAPARGLEVLAQAAMRRLRSRRHSTGRAPRARASAPPSSTLSPIRSPRSRGRRRRKGTSSTSTSGWSISPASPTTSAASAFHPDDWPKASAAWQHSLKTGEIYECRAPPAPP